MIFMATIVMKHAPYIAMDESITVTWRTWMNSYG